MKRRILLPFLFFGILNSLIAQSITQTIRGKITDKESNFYLVGANVTVYKDSVPVKQTLTDTTGNYKVQDIPLGMYALKVTYLGYSPIVMSKIIVNSAKEVILNMEMEESVTTIKEVIISSTDQDQNVKMVNGSVRTFSVEETNRYAGSRSDPARMVSNYAGVQGADDSRNDIVIRGNSPLGMLWRYEGIDIPNPNHFAIVGTTGGPLSILNNKVLDNSYFITGAFPAEYGNTVAGVFDLKMRNGNNEKHEFTGQFGFLGTELSAEGPLSKKNGSSYLVTYRYSTLKLFESLKVRIGTDAVPNYQDWSFKLNFPTKKNASISIFSIGGISKINTLVSTYKKPEDELYTQNDRDQYFGAAMNVTGISFIKSLNPTTYVKLVIAASLSESHGNANLVYRNPAFQIDSLVHKLGYRHLETKLNSHFFINKKISIQSMLQTGFQVNRYNFNMVDSNYNQLTYKFEKRINYKGSTYLIQPYIEWQLKATDHLVFNVGVHGQFLTLNNSSAIEPRGSIRWNFLPKQSITLSAGMHSQMQPTYIYFYHFPTAAGEEDVLHNKNMGFTRSNHYVLSYDYFFTHSVRLKIETYYQYLYNVPIEIASSSFSLINQGIGSKRFYPNQLVNKGTGKNYGLEFTIEKFFTKSFFFMYTLSLYNSKYRGSDGIERVTDFNGTYAMNLLAGKDIKISEKKTMGLGFKITNAGGRRYTPIDVAASKEAREDIYIDSLRNTLRFKSYFRADIKISYKVNTNKFTHEFGLDLVNIQNTKNIFSISYSTISNKVIENYQLGFLPLFYYKLDF